jgi:hypothetical protein
MRALAVVVALALLALAPAAAAKEIKRAQVCGSDGCATVQDSSDREILVDGGPPRRPPPAAPYYVLRLTIGTGQGHTDRLLVDAVPMRRALRGASGTWMVMPEAMYRLIARATAHHRAFSASSLSGAAAPRPAPREPAAAESPLWPEGIVLALVLAAVCLPAERAVRFRAAWRRA